VCRTWCDPLADACPSGSCVDASAGFYLPANSLGVCL
jgi:hypothetical protein